MPHIPPIRFNLVAGDGANLFTIVGEENTITITFPTSHNAQTSTTEGSGGASVNPVAVKTESLAGGRSKIIISFAHSHKS